jgi:hypothetical protein
LEHSGHYPFVEEASRFPHVAVQVLDETPQPHLG